jgi:hypothetical protein
MMRNCLKALLTTILILTVVALGDGTGSESAFSEDDYFYPEIDDSITVTGEISKIKMTNFSSNPWEELIITPSEGERYVLFGSLVEQLWKLNGTKIVTVSGLLKPKMQIQGNLTKVLEVHNIGKIEDIQDGKSSN